MPKWRERRKPSRRRAQAVKKRRIEKKLEVPQEQGVFQNKLGEDQPKTCRKEKHIKT
jgi:hypothetical protein